MDKCNIHLVVLVSGGLVKTSKTPTGGIFQYNQALALSEKIKKVTLLSSGYKNLYQLFNNDIYIKEEKHKNLNVYRDYNQLYFRKIWIPFNYMLKKHIKLGMNQFKKYISIHGKPDIIHCHNIFYSGFLAERIFLNYNIPYIITEHDSSFARGIIKNHITKKIKTLVKNRAMINTVSKLNLKTLKTKLDIDDIKIFPNLINPIFEYDDLIIEKNNFYTFINISNLDNNKNVELSISAFAKFKYKKKSKLIIVGKGPKKNYLNKLIENYNLTQSITIIEPMDPEKIKLYLKRSDCLILSSKYDTFGVVVIESLSQGTPVIVSDKVGVARQIIDESNGKIFQSSNEKEIINMMNFMYQNSRQIYDSRQIRKKIIKIFGKKSFLERSITNYEKVLNQHIL